MDPVQLVKDLGFPIAVSIYLFYSMNRQTKFYNEMVAKALNDTSNVIVSMSTQTAYMISAMMNYRNGDQVNGDMAAKQAVFIATDLKDKIKEKEANINKGGSDV